MKISRWKTAVVLSTAFLAAAVHAAGPQSPATAPFVGDQQGTEFWMMFITHREGARQALYITGETAANGVVSMPGLPASTAFSQPFSVVPGVTTFVQLPPQAAMAAADTRADRGVHVVSNAPVSVVALDYAGASSASYLAMPVDALGTRHIVLAQGGPGVRAGSEFGVAATRAGTVLTVTPSQAAQGHAAGVAFDVVLGPGQTWQLRSQDDGGDLSGSIVESTAPVAVFAGHACVDLDATATACDLVADAIPPVDSWGRSFLALPMFGSAAGTSAGPSTSTSTSTSTSIAEPAGTATALSYRIVAANDNTLLWFGGDERVVLAKGQVLERRSLDPAWIWANQPVMVAQYARSATRGAVGRIVPAVDQYRSAYTFGTPDLDHAVDIVVAHAGLHGIVLDGSPVPESRFAKIGASDFFAARLPLSTEGAHSITGTSPFNATVQWSGKGGAYAYSAGQSWAPLHFEPPRVCDPDNNGVIDARDVSLVLAARGTRSKAFDLRDANQDGVIDVVDARQCALQCSKTGCAR